MTHSRQPMYLSDNYNNSMKQIDPDTNADITLQSRINKIKVGTVAEQIIKVRIDEFLKTTPQNYRELSDAITSSLVWTGYEDCYVDEQVLQILIENFIKTI